MRDLYELVSQHGNEMHKSELIEIAKEVIYKLYSTLSTKEYNKALKSLQEEDSIKEIYVDYDEEFNVGG